MYMYIYKYIMQIMSALVCTDSVSVCLGMAKPGLAWNWRPTLGTRLGPQTWSPGGAQLG